LENALIWSELSQDRRFLDKKCHLVYFCRI